MKKYSIQTWTNNPILRAISQEIEKIDKDIIDFSAELIRLMRRNQWVWLAAPQVGKNWRIIATTQWEEKKWKRILVWETIMINPKISWQSVDLFISEEACISLPDMIGNVKRNKSVVVEYMNLKWQKHKKKFKDFNATIIQHELDHLDGVLFTDKVIKDRRK